MRKNFVLRHNWNMGERRTPNRGVIYTFFYMFTLYFFHVIRLSISKTSLYGPPLLCIISSCFFLHFTTYEPLWKTPFIVENTLSRWQFCIWCGASWCRIGTQVAHNFNCLRLAVSFWLFCLLRCFQIQNCLTFKYQLLICYYYYFHLYISLWKHCIHYV